MLCKPLHTNQLMIMLVYISLMSVEIGFQGNKHLRDGHLRKPIFYNIFFGYYKIEHFEI
jgi:hypothetical protein